MVIEEVCDADRDDAYMRSILTVETMLFTLDLQLLEELAQRVG